MARTIFALLVGINDYEGGVSNLYGCVNDVKRFQEFLKVRTEGGDFILNSRVLTSGNHDDLSETKPTRQAVIDGFRHHLCKAGEKDIALFYYSGHGSQEIAPEVFWPGEPDHLNETLVCIDSRLPGNYDLADKELALLIQEVATQDEQANPKPYAPHIIVILDSCHSGSGTRELGDTHIRLAPTDQRSRPLNTYIFSPGLVKDVATDAGNGDWFMPPKGRHVLLSACTSDEAAKERNLGDDAEPRGVFSYYLLESLKRSGRTLTYYDLATRVCSQVRNTVTLQTPQIESTEASVQFTTVFDGALRPRPAYFQVNWSDNNDSWMLAAGAMQGIQRPVGNETTRLALFPFEQQELSDEVNRFTGRAIGDAVGFARVTQVWASQSQVTLEQLKESEDRKRAYFAVVVSQPMPPMQVALEGDRMLLDTIRKELNQQVLDDDISLVVQEASDPTKARLRLEAIITAESTEEYNIYLASDAYSRTVPARNATTAVARLAHVARWLLLAGLENKASQLPEDAVRIEMHRVETKDVQDVHIPVNGWDVMLNYSVREGKPQPPRFKLTVHNNTERELYCAVLDLPESFGIFEVDIAGGACAKLAPKGQAGASASLTNAKGEPIIYFEIPKWLRSKKIDKLTDELKIFISTEEINPALLIQEDITDIVMRGGSSKSAEEQIPKSTLGRLMRRVQTRHAGGQDGNDLISDWKTYEIRVTTIWPLDAVAIPDEGTSAKVSEELTVQGHPGLQAKAQLKLKPFDVVSRDPDLPSVPPILRSTPESIQPFEFTPSRSAGPGHSTIELELDNTADYSQLTPEAPLIMNLAQPLGESETVLMVSYDYDSGNYLPIGFGYPKDGGTEIRVQSLPKPKTTGEKDVKGALLMLAYKLVPEKVAATIGLENPYPLLRVATVGEDGITQYEERGEAYLREQVEKARRILLFIHGWTGDTRGMIASTRVLSQLAPEYDLILAFDYENINTRIQDTAIKLRERLENVGLAAGHGKVVHIVAHSLGTQVSRWFIERDGGNQVVSKLVMMGPPNAGSPLAVLEEWAIYLIGLALNGLLYVVNPASAIVQLVRFASAAVAGAAKVDATLDQIKPNSEFYKDLNRSPDPNCPYYVVIGSTNEIKYGTPAGQTTRTLSQMLAQSFSPRMVHRVSSLAFANQPNDMAVSVQSAESVALLKPERNPKPSVVVVDCDHVNYFSSDVGLKALAAALKA